MFSISNLFAIFVLNSLIISCGKSNDEYHETSSNNTIMSSSDKTLFSIWKYSYNSEIPGEIAKVKYDLSKNKFGDNEIFDIYNETSFRKIVCTMKASISGDEKNSNIKIKNSTLKSFEIEELYYLSKNLVHPDAAALCRGMIHNNNDNILFFRISYDEFKICYPGQSCLFIF